MQVKDDRIAQRIKMNHSGGKINLLESTENHTLSLRKNRLDLLLMSKRTKDFPSQSSYEISLAKLDLGPEYKELAEQYTHQIKANSFEVRSIWDLLFNNNGDLNKLKLALFFLFRFITHQIETLDKEERELFLSRNNFDVINLLCSLLQSNDVQVKYTCASSLINLTLFPKKIEERIYTNDNLNHIYQALIISDFVLLPPLIDLVRNCCVTSASNALFFMKKKVLDAYCIVLKHKDTCDETKVRILKCVSVLSKVLKANLDLRDGFREIVKMLKPLISRMDVLEDHFHFVHVLLSGLTSSSAKLCDLFLSADFVSSLFKLYEKRQDQEKVEVLNLIVNFLAGNDSSTQIMIDQGVISLLKSSLNEFKYKSKSILSEIAWATANITSGTLGQCEMAEASGILIDLMEIGRIAYVELKAKEIYEDNLQLLQEILYALCNGITGGSNQVKVSLLQYENGLVLRMIAFGLLKYENNSTMLWILLSALRAFIIFEENLMADASIKKILCEENVEAALNHLYNNKYDANTISLIEGILFFMNE